MNYLKQSLGAFSNFKNTTLVIIFSLLLVISCNDNEETNNLETFDIKTFETQSEIEKTNDGINTMVEDVYYFEEIFDSRNPSQSFLPDCVTITSIMEQNIKTVTIDFGDGCELRNGDFASGKILIEYNRNPDELTKTIQVSFVDFYFNDKNITGNKIIERMRLNTNGNTQATHNTNITVTWPDGSFVSSQGQRVREWIEGFGSGFWQDNVYLITGNWTFVKKNGNILIGTITTPLRRELTCRFLVSGVVELNKNGNVGSLDYGNGTCDALGILTINGEEHEIHVRH